MLSVNSERLASYRSDARVVTDCAPYLLEQIRTRQARVAIIGLGYVGLPLAVAYAESGFHVTGIDIDVRRVDALNAGRSPVADVPSEQLQRLLPKNQMATDLSVMIGPQLTEDGNERGRNGNGYGREETSSHGSEAVPSDFHEEAARPRGSFRATTDYDVLFDVDAVIICVPTPLSTTKDPDMSFIIAAGDEIARRLHSGMLIVLESTTYPGTTEEIILPRLHASRSNGPLFKWVKISSWPFRRSALIPVARTGRSTRRRRSLAGQHPSALKWPGHSTSVLSRRSCRSPRRRQRKWSSCWRIPSRGQHRPDQRSSDNVR